MGLICKTVPAVTRDSQGQTNPPGKWWLQCTAMSKDESATFLAMTLAPGLKGAKSCKTHCWMSNDLVVVCLPTTLIAQGCRNVQNTGWIRFLDPRAQRDNYRHNPGHLVTPVVSRNVPKYSTFNSKTCPGQCTWMRSKNPCPSILTDVCLTLLLKVVLTAQNTLMFPG